MRADDDATGIQRDERDFAALLAAAQVGGEWALSILYRRHDPAIVRYLRARAGADGDDLASQTWLDAARNLTAFAGDEDQLRGWLFTIARRRLIDHQRRRARRREEPVDDLDLAELRASDDPAGEVHVVLAGDEAAHRIVELLPPAQAEIVLLRVVAGLTVAEVAHVTGRRPGTVRVMQHRALHRLAQRLSEDGM